MKIIRWSAVIASGFLGLLLLFSITENDTTTESRFVRVILGVIGIAGAFGLFRAERWGKPVVIVFGLLLVVLGVVSITIGQTAAAAAVVIVPGLVVTLLGALSETNGPLRRFSRTTGGVGDAPAS
ncbi:hypothetical protein [Smaragdicoccus niigatensis]|uniref:hypothetical protein n=1 Tax=Smaragdicoccus niigatensis TaxID=359359 RepID=UPI00035CD761|nr:hypothetical protein [Smaragdicoccus niigatensis]